MYIGFYVIYPLLISDLNENLNFLHTMGKYSDIKSHENPGCFMRAGGWAGGREGGWADTHEEANTHFSQLSESA